MAISWAILNVHVLLLDRTELPRACLEASPLMRRSDATDSTHQGKLAPGRVARKEDRGGDDADDQSSWTLFRDRGHMVPVSSSEKPKIRENIAVRIRF